MNGRWSKSSSSTAVASSCRPRQIDPSRNDSRLSPSRAGCEQPPRTPSPKWTADVDGTNRAREHHGFDPRWPIAEWLSHLPSMHLLPVLSVMPIPRFAVSHGTALKKVRAKSTSSRQVSPSRRFPDRNHRHRPALTRRHELKTILYRPLLRDLYT
jgi:hypothetical protein